MKAKRRHELQENVLNAELAGIVEFLRKRGTAILVGLLVVALVGFVISWAYSKSRQKHTRLHAQLEQAATGAGLTPDERVSMLEGLAGQDDDKSIVAQALVALGNEYSARMIAAGSGGDPAQRKRLADKAASYYRGAISDHADQKPLVAVAHLGLGKLAESRSDFDAARGEYQAALAMTELAGHPVVDRVRSSLAQLDELSEPVLMATTRSAEPEPAAETRPATQPTTGPSDLPAVTEPDR